MNWFKASLLMAFLNGGMFQQKIIFLLIHYYYKKSFFEKLRQFLERLNLAIFVTYTFLHLKNHETWSLLCKIQCFGHRPHRNEKTTNFKEKDSLFADYLNIFYPLTSRRLV